jgi:hypothetical protein
MFSLPSLRRILSTSPSGFDLQSTFFKDHINRTGRHLDFHGD